jgi:hypothetical protein
VGYSKFIYSWKPSFGARVVRTKAQKRKKRRKKTSNHARPPHTMLRLRTRPVLYKLPARVP